MRAFLLKSLQNLKKNCEKSMNTETLTFFFFLIGVPILIGMVLKFLFGKAPPPKPDQEITDELLDEIEHTSSRRRRHKRTPKTRSSSDD